jgi:hypothetical protein
MNKINDIRTIDVFKNMTFSGYKLSDVKKELMDCINNSKIENLCYWTSELISSAHFLLIWEIIILYTSKHIHTGNIKLCLYLNIRYLKFKSIINNGYVGNELKMRNSELVRRIFIEIMCVLAFSNKKYEIKRIKVDKIDYKIEHLKSKLKADSLKYVVPIFKDNDPKDLFMALNEFMYHLNESRDIISLCYWIEWIIQYEVICKKNKETCEAEPRCYDVDDKFNKDIIWILWDGFKHTIDNNPQIYNKNIISKLYTALLSLFTMRYSCGVKRRRIYILYMMGSILIEKIDYSVNIINNKGKIDNIVSNNGKLFKQIKKCEVTKNGTGMLANTGKWNEGNLEKTLKLLDIMDTV